MKSKLLSVVSGELTDSFSFQLNPVEPDQTRPAISHYPKIRNRSAISSSQQTAQWAEAIQERISEIEKEEEEKIKIEEFKKRLNERMEIEEKMMMEKLFESSDDRNTVQDDDEEILEDCSQDTPTTPPPPPPSPPQPPPPPPPPVPAINDEQSMKDVIMGLLAEIANIQDNLPQPPKPMQANNELQSVGEEKIVEDMERKKMTIWPFLAKIKKDVELKEENVMEDTNVNKRKGTVIGGYSISIVQDYQPTGLEKDEQRAKATAVIEALQSLRDHLQENLSLSKEKHNVQQLTNDIRPQERQHQADLIEELSDPPESGSLTCSANTGEVMESARAMHHINSVPRSKTPTRPSLPNLPSKSSRSSRPSRPSRPFPPTLPSIREDESFKTDASLPQLAPLYYEGWRSRSHPPNALQPQLAGEQWTSRPFLTTRTFNPSRPFQPSRPEEEIVKPASFLPQAPMYYETWKSQSHHEQVDSHTLTPAVSILVNKESKKTTSKIAVADASRLSNQSHTPYPPHLSNQAHTPNPSHPSNQSHTPYPSNPSDPYYQRTPKQIDSHMFTPKLNILVKNGNTVTQSQMILQTSEVRPFK